MMGYAWRWIGEKAKPRDGTLAYASSHMQSPCQGQIGMLDESNVSGPVSVAK